MTSPLPRFRFQLISIKLERVANTIKETWTYRFRKLRADEQLRKQPFDSSDLSKVLNTQSVQKLRIDRAFEPFKAVLKRKNPQMVKDDKLLV